MFSAEQVDALKEYMNQFIGQSASLLSEMINKKVQLEIPDIQLFKRELVDNVQDLLPEIFKSYVVSSNISFGDNFSGQARLVFPKQKIKKLVALCMDEELDASDDLTDTDFDAIRELGNIILNAIVGSMGNLVELKLDYDMPMVEVIHIPTEAEKIFSKESEYLLLIKNKFSVDGDNIEGVIMVMLSMSSTDVLIKKVDQLMVEIYG